MEQLRSLVEGSRNVALPREGQILAQVHDAVIATDLTGRITLWNAGAERLYGYSGTEVLGQSIGVLYFDEDQKVLQERVIAPLLTSGQHQLELRVRTKCGQAAYVHLSLSLLRDEKGLPAGMIGYSLDITERKRAEEAVRDVALFPEQNPFPVLRVRSDGTLLYANAGSAELLAELETAVGKRVPELVWEVVRLALEAQETQEHFLMMGDRKLSFMLVPIAKRGYVNLYGRDVTEHKRAETALRQSEQRLKLAQQAAKIGTFEWNVQTGVNVWSPELEAMYGLAPGEFGKTQPAWEQLVHPEDRTKAVSWVNQAFATGEPVEGDWRVIWGDGSVHWITGRFQVFKDAAGKPLYLSGVNIEITERKRAEEALRQSQEDLAHAQKVGQIGSWRLDVRHNILNWSDEIHRIFGVPKGKPLTYETFLGTIHPDDRQYVDTQWKAALRGEPYDIEHRLVADGQVKWVREKAYLEFDKDGRLLGGFGITQDITQRKEMLDALTQAKEELRHRAENLEKTVAERTARLRDLVGELEHFSYTITHDMRAPLRGMQGFAEMMAETCANCKQQDAVGFLQRIRRSGERMDTLITDALNYSKTVRQELPLALVDLSDLLSGILDSYPEFQPTKAEITVEGELPVVLGNQAGLTQCFSNLLGNAVKFVKPGEKPEIRIRSERREGWVRVWIEDRGIGIPESLKGRVFEMFSRGSNKYEGTGIGLALVRKVIQQMGGKVGVESEERKGSRFWFELKPGDARNS